MKRVLAIILAGILMASLAACGSEPSSAGSADNVSEGAKEETGSVKKEEKQEAPEFKEVVAVDNDECTIKITGMDPDSIWGYTLNAYLENKSEKKTYMYAIEGAAVNGVQCDPLFAAEVAPGKKGNETISFTDSSLEKSGIEDFTDIEMHFRVYDSDNWGDDDVAKETVHIYPQGEKAVKMFQRKSQDTDQILVDNEYVTVTVTGYEEDDIWGYTANLFIQNKSDASVMIAAEDVSVNGYMADPLFARSVLPGKCAFSSMSWSDETLSENNIEKIEEIEFTLRVYDDDNWDKEYVNEKVTLKP